MARAKAPDVVKADTAPREVTATRRATKRKRLSAIEADAAHAAREERERERATISVRLAWLQPYAAEANALERRLQQIGD